MTKRNDYRIRIAALVLNMLVVGASARAQPLATPIEHVVVIFQENISFDHYFATYPKAVNPPGQPRFIAAPGTPSVNGLNGSLLSDNPNSANPFRLDRTQAITCDMDHDYTEEQRAANAGLMNRFIEETGASYNECNPEQVMGYYDGNVVTALWNYAQHFAMSDNSFGTTFGPSTVGALNLVAGQTHGALPADLPGEVAGGTVIADPDPAYDDCSGSAGQTVAMKGKNIGNLLTDAQVSWGWFQGGFRPTAHTGDRAVCGAVSINIVGGKISDYSPHHEPFQYYASTANPHHLPPSTPAMIGQADQANHQYDLSDFWVAADAGNLPAVSFLKAKMYQDGHAGYSSPLDEQTFLVETLNRIQRLPQWKNIAVIIAYDDSDGWYDHVLGPIVNPSGDPGHDALTGPGRCGKVTKGSYPDRCGYGPRLPLLVISPWARQNFVDHSVTDQTSVLRFIEDNWHLGRIGDQSFDSKAGSLLNMFDFSGGTGRRPLFLDPGTGLKAP